MFLAQGASTCIGMANVAAVHTKNLRIVQGDWHREGR